MSESEKPKIEKLRFVDVSWGRAYAVFVGSDGGHYRISGSELYDAVERSFVGRRVAASVEPKQKSRTGLYFGWRNVTHWEGGR